MISLLLGLGTLGSRGVAQPYFYDAANFATGNGPAALIAADFNRDGKLDLAVCNYTDNTVSILLGGPNGSFANQRVYATGPSPVALVAADFNGDGRLDLAVVTNMPGGGGFSVLLGNGDGTFQNHLDYPTGNGPLGVVAADFNRDGKIDLALANRSSPDVSILLGNGNGTFQSQMVVPVAGPQVDIKAADFNGDGKIDIVTFSNPPFGNSTISVLLNNGNATFSRVDSSVASSNVGSMAVGDFNRDGKPDVAISQVYGFSVQVLFGKGDGTFPNSTSVPVSFQPYWVVAGDFDHDGKTDLAVSPQRFYVPQTIALISGKGDGTFSPAVNVEVGQTPNGFIVNDFNRDGRFDLALVANSGSVSILLGNGTHSFGNVVQFPLSTGAGVVADFNGDGKPDLCLALNGSPSGEISVQLGKGDGTFEAALNSRLASAAVSSMTVGDFNNDGKTDVAVTNANLPSFSVLLGNGDGTLQTPVTTGIGSTLSPTSITAADFNSDGKSDVAVTTYDGNSGVTSVKVYLSNGNGTFVLAAHYSVTPIFNPPFSNPALMAADFNHDGKPDLVVSGGQSSSVFILIGNGDGTFQNPVAYTVGLTSAATLTAGDFNRDGNTDVAVGGEFGISVLLGNGDGTFRPHVDSPTPAFNPGPITVADFNGDGKPDLATSSTNNNSVILVLLGKGNGTFATPVTLPVLAPMVALVGDFNSDGFPDVAAPAIGSGTSPSSFALLLSTPTVGLSRSAISFGPQKVGSPSTPRSVTLTNIGNGPLESVTVSVTGNNAADFAQTDTCGRTILVGSNCLISIVFDPAALGRRTAIVSIRDNALGSPQSVSLIGMGATY